MTLFTVSGSNTNATWSVVYDDTGPSVTAQADGAGHGTAVIEQADGKSAAVEFVQAGGPFSVPVPVPPDLTVNAHAQVVIGSGPVTRATPLLKPIAPVKPGGQGSFRVANVEWRAS